MRNLKSKAIIDLKQKEKLSLEVLRLDLTDDISIKETIHKITNEQESIDVFVNNAEYALVGSFEEIPIEGILYEPPVTSKIYNYKITLPTASKGKISLGLVLQGY
jgi:NADP-dependent 3-hydroxy acid dehydrogenase YdfG